MLWLSLFSSWCCLSLHLLHYNARYGASDYLLLLHSRGKWSNFCPKRLPMPGPVIGASHTMPLLVSLNFWFLKLTTGGSLVLAGCYGDNPTWIWIRTKSPPRFNVQLKHNGQMEVYTLSYVQLGKNPRWAFVHCIEVVKMFALVMLILQDIVVRVKD